MCQRPRLLSFMFGRRRVAMRRRASVLAWASVPLFGVALAGCGSGGGTTANSTTPSTDFNAHKGLFAAVRGAGRATLYEGLPHQFFEPTTLEQERAGKPTVTLHGFPFYQETLPLTADDENTLKRLLGDEGSFGRFS